MKNLSEAEAAALARFLASPAQPDDTLTYHALQGFFFALACSPELAQPSEWLPLVFGGQAPNFSGEKGAEAALGRIMKLYNQITHETLRGEAGLPADCRFRDEVLANLEEDAPISQWSSGFLTGHLWLREAWDDYVPKSLEKAFTADVMGCEKSNRWKSGSCSSCGNSIAAQPKPDVPSTSAVPFVTPIQPGGNVLCSSW